MGFGWLFIGYFLIVMRSPILSSAVHLLGCGLVVFALLKLREYNRSFDVSMIGALLLLLVSGVLLFADVNKILYDNLIVSANLFSDSLKTAIGYAEQGASFVFNATLLWGVLRIARETKVTKIANSAIRNFVFICLYYIAYLVSFLPFENIKATQAEFALICWVLYIAWMIMNLILIFTCYAKICDENDVDMERKPSRFEFVNRFREERDRREQSAREADVAYRKEKQERKNKRRRK